MSKTGLFLLAFLLVSLFSMNEASTGFGQTGFSSGLNTSASSNGKYADRLDVYSVLNNPEYTDTSKVSKTKRDWVYRHAARSGSLFIRTGSGKVLHPGELNTVRNAVKFQDFIEDYFIKLPNARENTRYTLLAYSEGYLAKALSNLRGEDLYKGIRGEMLGDVFADIDVDELGKTVVTDTKYCVEILEQTQEHLTNNSEDIRENWKNNPAHCNIRNELSGTAGKTCFVVLPKGMEELDKDFYNEFELLIETFESHLNPSSLGTSSADIATEAVNRAVRMQRQADYVGRPSQTSLYYDDPYYY